MYPYLINFGFLKIRFYGVMYAIGLYLGLMIFEKEVKRKHIQLSSSQIQNLVFTVFFFSLFSARIYYVLYNTDWYFGPYVPWYEFLAVWHGGLAIHGAILGSIIPIYFYSRHYKIKFFDLSDMLVLGLILGQALGRIGNFMNGDAHGIPTDLPWGMIFSYGPASLEYPQTPLHPVMLYESILNLLAFLFLWNIRTKRLKAGVITTLYIVLYSLIRSFVTIFRADDLYLFARHIDQSNHWFVGASTQIMWGIRGPHALSIIGIIAAIIMVLSLKLYKK